MLMPASIESPYKYSQQVKFDLFQPQDYGSNMVNEMLIEAAASSGPSSRAKASHG
jgi:hypothetical protein